MKVLLINPPFSSSFPSLSCYPPLGLASLAAVLESNGIDVQIIDAAVEELSADECAGKALSASPDLVGITAMTPTYPQALKVARLIKSQKNIPICIGGFHATFLPEETLATGVFDYLVRGEGEFTFLDLCKSLQENKDVKSIAGLSYYKNKKVKNNVSREFILDLNTLPRPAYHLLDFDKYQSKAPPGFVRKKPWLTMVTSRGCPFSCKFCSSSVFWGKCWRGFSPERVVTDVELVLDRYDLKSLFFVDDNFTFFKRRVEKICSLIKEKSLEFEFTCNCRVDQVDLDLLSKMYSAGCWRIGFGIEAGTQEVLDWYEKGFSLDEAKSAIEACKKVGISPICYFIIGAPVETEKTIERTIEFAKELDADAVGFSFLIPFPGSWLYEYCVENNLLVSTDWEKYTQDVPLIKMQNLSMDSLQKLGRLAYRKYYFRSKFILRQLISSFKSPTTLWNGFKTILKWFFKSGE
ncbi:MAG: radical SAM protein [Candidatus Aenigmarchaeota archaeon]|nr:radical SAM protein [Candidatus Aenigmarchaeota archaeon]